MASFWLANQNSVSNQPISVRNLIRPCPPHRVHKPWYPLGFLHSDSTHQRQHLHPTTSSIQPLCQHVPADALIAIACFISYKYPSASTSICKVSSFILHTDFQAYSASLNPSVNSFFLFQMAALNFEHILMMLKDGGTIP